MAKYGLTHHFKGGTKEQYDNTVKVVHPNDGKGLPAGQTYHAAGPTSDGFVVVAIWDSAASWETFRDGTLLPGLATIANAIPAPPTETTFEVHNEVTA
jgi:hypothetical protein